MPFNTLDELFDRISNETIFMKLLDMLLVCHDGKEILLKNASKILASNDIDIFKFIFNKKYRNLFMTFVTQNTPTLFRMLVKKYNPKYLYAFIFEYSKTTFENSSFLLVDSPHFIHTLYTLHQYYKEDIYQKNKEIIFSEFTKRIKFEIENIKFTSLFISFLAEIDKVFIELNIGVILKMLRELFDTFLRKGFMYNGDIRNKTLNDLVRVTNKNAQIHDYLKSDKRFLIVNLTGVSLEDLKEEKIYVFFEELLKELENLTGLDIKDMRITSGETSTVLIIGDIVVKFNDSVKEITYDPCLLRPLIRTNIHFENTDIPLLGLEIYNRVKTDDIDENRVYEMFKGALKRGIYLSDICVENTGILIYPNTPHLKGAHKIDENGNMSDYDVEDKDVHINSDGKIHDTFKEGSYVCYDLEYIYTLSFDIDEKIKELLEKMSPKEISDHLDSMLTGLVNDEAREFLERYAREISDVKRLNM